MILNLTLPVMNNLPLWACIVLFSTTLNTYYFGLFVSSLVSFCTSLATRKLVLTFLFEEKINRGMHFYYMFRQVTIVSNPFSTFSALITLKLSCVGVNFFFHMAPQVTIVCKLFSAISALITLNFPMSMWILFYDPSDDYHV